MENIRDITQVPNAFANKQEKFWLLSLKESSQVVDLLYKNGTL